MSENCLIVHPLIPNQLTVIFSKTMSKALLNLRSIITFPNIWNSQYFIREGNQVSYASFTFGKLTHHPLHMPKNAFHDFPGDQSEVVWHTFPCVDLLAVCEDG